MQRRSILTGFGSVISVACTKHISEILILSNITYETCYSQEDDEYIMPDEEYISIIPRLRNPELDFPLAKRFYYASSILQLSESLCLPNLRTIGLQKFM